MGITDIQEIWVNNPMVSDVYQSVANESTGGITIPH